MIHFALFASYQTQGDSATALIPQDLVTDIDRLAVFPFLVDYGYVLLAAAVVAGLIILAAHKEWRDALLYVFLPAAGLGTAGLTIGILVGNSLTSIVSVALSGFLTIYSGLVVYLYGKEAQKSWNRIAGATGLAFVACGIVYGASVGAAFRYRFQRQDSEWHDAMEQRKKQFETRLGVWDYSQRKRIDLLGDSLKSTWTKEAGTKATSEK